MSCLACKIADWLINLRIIQKEDRELYEYAAYSICITMFPLVFGIVIGGIEGNIKGYVFVIIPFLLFRKFSGGYHANHIVICLVESIILLVITVRVASSNIRFSYILVTTIVLMICLIVNSPIDSENRRLDDYEKNTCKHIVWVICGILFVIGILLYILDYSSELRYIMCGVILTAVMQIPGIIEKVRGKYNKPI